MADDLVLTDTWWDLRAGGLSEQQQRQALHAELAAELSPGHPLYGQEVTVLARSTTSDDVLVSLSRGDWAIVHLTWSRTTATPPWPRTAVYDSLRCLEQDLADELYQA